MDDPIWGAPSITHRIGPDTYAFSNDRSGKFETDPQGLNRYIQNWSPADRAKISTWVLDQNRFGAPANVNVTAIKHIEAASALSINEKIDRFFLMLDSSGYRPGDTLPWGPGIATAKTVALQHSTMLWTECASDNEFYALRDILADAGLIVATEGRSTRLGPAGLARLERVNQGASDTKQAFVAMWFDQSTEAVFVNGIEPALTLTGFKAQRIDRKEHTNKIDDEIVAEIKRSRFLVADFTCEALSTENGIKSIARGGVYYEAGFAQGLGIPVIWSVRSDQIGLVHFDTRQYNHITWETPEDLKEKLYQRVSAVIL